MTEGLVRRINELAKKKREQGLDPEEIREQKELYDTYLANIRQQVKNQLEAISHPPRCSCDECGHKHKEECQ